MARIIAPPDVLKRSRPDLYARIFGGGSALGQGAGGGSGTTTPSGEYVPTTGGYIPPHGGSPFPYNPETGGVGYNMGAGGYASVKQSAPPETPMGASQKFQPQQPPPNVVARPGATGYGYGAPPGQQFLLPSRRF